jgi:hypothetical protein
LVQLGKIARIFLAKNDVKAGRERILGVYYVGEISGGWRQVGPLKAI